MLSTVKSEVHLVEGRHLLGSAILDETDREL